MASPMSRSISWKRPAPSRREAAMKFVRQYWEQTGHPGKYKFISRYHSYHGGASEISTV